MAALNPAYPDLNRFDHPQHGAFLSSFGTACAVANEDAHLVTGGTSDLSRDIYAALAGTATNASKVRVLGVPKDYAYLDLHHIWTSPTVDTTNGITTAPTVRVFGRKPHWVPNSPISSGGGRKYPYDIVTTHPDITASTWGTHKGIWVPLLSPAYETGAPELVFNVNDPIRSIIGAVNLHVSEPQSVFLAGCEEVAVLIDTAAVYSGTGVGLILASFVS